MTAGKGRSRGWPYSPEHYDSPAPKRSPERYAHSPEHNHNKSLGKLVRRPCTVCRHPERTSIELMVARGASRRAVAKHYGDLSADAIYRHWRKHVPDHVKVATKIELLKPGAELEDLVQEESIGLLTHLRRIRDALYLAFDAKAQSGDAHGLALISSQLHQNLKLSATKTGELQQHSRTQINNLILAPDYLNLRVRLIAALRPYPEAAAAVAEAFRNIEAGVDQGVNGRPVRMVGHA